MDWRPILLIGLGMLLGLAAGWFALFLLGYWLTSAVD